ncbi:MAG: hypothetical protein HY791_09980 [Deltaproteobacteria bacterium]|nr:hypothetical protein [Deltaproteobacteria bacterium]
MRFDGLELSAPDDFVVEETTIALRAPPGPTESRILQKQFPIRPNLIMNRKRVGLGATLALLTAEVTAELASTIIGLRALATDEIRFDDGCEGIIVSFEFPMREVASVRQFHALRLDDGIFTDVTLTVDGMTLNEAAKAKWLTVLSSARRESKS